MFIIEDDLLNSKFIQIISSNYRPAIGDVRRVHIDKSVEPLGIQIAEYKAKGVYVSSVTEDSIASKAELLVGHQLLEVCGVNLRQATYNLAASVLQQCGNSITMLVQYNPESKILQLVKYYHITRRSSFRVVSSFKQTY